MCSEQIHHILLVPHTSLFCCTRPPVYILMATTICRYGFEDNVSLIGEPRSTPTTMNKPGVLRFAAIAGGIARGARCITRYGCMTYHLPVSNNSAIGHNDASACHADVNAGEFCMPKVRRYQEIRQTQLLCSRRRLVQEMWRCR